VLIFSSATILVLILLLFLFIWIFGSEVEAARLVRPRRTQEPAGTRRRGHCTHDTKKEIEHAVIQDQENLRQ
jgi:hypothetical protein